MSKDLSSKEKTSTDRSQKYFKALLLVFGTTILFFLGQVIGVYLVIAIAYFLGYDSTQIKSLLTDNHLVQFLTILIIEIVTLGLLWRIHKYFKQPFIKSIRLKNKPKFSSFGYAAIAYGVYKVLSRR
jgi:Sec-independent protein secretion pathway component TatC